MVKFTSKVVSAALFAGLSSQGVDAFAPIKTSSHASALMMVCSQVMSFSFESCSLPGGSDSFWVPRFQHESFSKFRQLPTGSSNLLLVYLQHGI
jgi:hypothetical protein